MTTDLKTNPLEHVTLTEEERAELLELLQTALGDVRVELHHTHTPDFRDKVQNREAILRGLLDKFRSVKA